MRGIASALTVVLAAGCYTEGYYHRTGTSFRGHRDEVVPWGVETRVSTRQRKRAVDLIVTEHRLCRTVEDGAVVISEGGTKRKKGGTTGMATAMVAGGALVAVLAESGDESNDAAIIGGSVAIVLGAAMWLLPKWRKVGRSRSVPARAWVGEPQPCGGSAPAAGVTVELRATAPSGRSLSWRETVPASGTLPVDLRALGHWAGTCDEDVTLSVAVAPEGSDRGAYEARRARDHNPQGFRGSVETGTGAGEGIDLRWRPDPLELDVPRLAALDMLDPSLAHARARRVLGECIALRQQRREQRVAGLGAARDAHHDDARKAWRVSAVGSTPELDGFDHGVLRRLPARTTSATLLSFRHVRATHGGFLGQLLAALDATDLELELERAGLDVRTQLGGAALFALEGWTGPVPFRGKSNFHGALLRVRYDRLQLARLLDRLGLPSRVHGATRIWTLSPIDIVLWRDVVGVVAQGMGPLVADVAAGTAPSADRSALAAIGRSLPTRGAVFISADPGGASGTFFDGDREVRYVADFPEGERASGDAMVEQDNRSLCKSRGEVTREWVGTRMTASLRCDGLQLAPAFENLLRGMLSLQGELERSAASLRDYCHARTHRVYAVDVAGEPHVGPDVAKVTLVVAGAFGERFLRRALPTLAELQRRYAADLRIVYKDFIISPANSAVAARAACAAHRQGRFADMVAMLWAELWHDGKLDRDRAVERVMIDLARELGLDVEQFEDDLIGSACQAEIDDDRVELDRFAQNSAPWFYVNGRPIAGVQPLACFESVIDEELGFVDAALARGERLADYYQRHVIQSGRRWE